MSNTPAQRLSVLNSVVQAVARPCTFAELLRAVHTQLSTVIDVTVFIVGIYHEASHTVNVVHQTISGAEVPGGSFPLGKGFTSQVIITGTPRLIRRWSHDGPHVQVQYATERNDLPESGLTVPIRLQDHVVGVLMLQSYAPEAYDEDDIPFLETVASLLGMAISGQKAIEAQDALLQQHVIELEAILSSMVDGLIIVDNQGRVSRLNQAARRLISADTDSIILGYPLDQAQVGRWPLGSLALARALEPMLEALRRGEAVQDVEVETRGDGRRALSISSAPIRDLDGALAGGVIVLRDVTGRHEMERIKDEVLSIASHDLRTPVTAIQTQAQLLKRLVERSRATPETLLKGLSTILRRTDGLGELLGLLLDLSRIESGRLDLDPMEMDLVELVTGVVESVQAMSDRHVLELTAPPAVEGLWDLPRIRQVLQNLLTNAVKYAPEGGRIEVRVELEDRSVTVTVRDSGIGLAHEELGAIFERFYRADTSRRLEGSGLGLYICQTIIAAHGGRIWAESDGIGLGSTFSFSLPRRAAVAPGRTETCAEPAAGAESGIG